MPDTGLDCTVSVLISIWYSADALLSLVIVRLRLVWPSGRATPLTRQRRKL